MSSVWLRCFRRFPPVQSSWHFVQALVGLLLSIIGLGDVDLPHASSASHSRSGLDGHSEFDSLLCVFVSTGIFGIHHLLLNFLV